MRRVISFIVVLFWVSNGYSQKDMIASYLDDGGRSAVKDLIKTDLSEYFKSHIQIIWEHSFDDNFSLETSVGCLANNIYEPFFNEDLVKGSTIYENLNGGLSFSICPVVYHNGLESMRFSFPFKIHYYFGQAMSYEFNFGIGKQWFLSRRLSIDIGSGLGLNFETSLDDYSYIFHKDLRFDINSVKDDVGVRLIVPLTIRMGYIF